MTVLQKHFTSAPDILCLQEIEGVYLFPILKPLLEQWGYTSVHWFPGTTIRFNGIRCGIVMASKHKAHATALPVDDINKIPGPGGGAGMIHIPLLNVDVIGCHFPFEQRKDRFATYIKEVCKEPSNKPTILLGDFNLSYEPLCKHAPILTSRYQKISTNHPTCSLTPGLKRKYFENIDHIFVSSNIKSLKSNYTIDTLSDHALVWNEIALPTTIPSST